MIVAPVSISTIGLNAIVKTAYSDTVLSVEFILIYSIDVGFIAFHFNTPYWIILGKLNLSIVWNVATKYLGWIESGLYKESSNILI